MADNKRSRKYDDLHKNPDFAVVCSFLNKFNSLLNSPDITFENLETWISEQRPISSTFKDFLLILLKRWRSSVNDGRFSKYLIKFCESYSPSDAAELEKFGFEKCSADIKIRLIKNLVEQQFNTNTKFKEKVNMISADELRVQPIGRDIKGRMYWSFMDRDMNLRIFCGELTEGVGSSEKKWEIIARNRNELLELISSLQNSDLSIEKLSLSCNNDIIKDDKDDDDDNNNGDDDGNDGLKIDYNAPENEISNEMKVETIKKENDEGVDAADDNNVKEGRNISDCDRNVIEDIATVANEDDGGDKNIMKNLDNDKKITEDLDGDKSKSSNDEVDNYGQNDDKIKTVEETEDIAASNEDGDHNGAANDDDHKGAANDDDDDHEGGINDDDHDHDGNNELKIQSNTSEIITEDKPITNSDDNNLKDAKIDNDDHIDNDLSHRSIIEDKVADEESKDLTPCLTETAKCAEDGNLQDNSLVVPVNSDPIATIDIQHSNEIVYEDVNSEDSNNMKSTSLIHENGVASSDNVPSIIVELISSNDADENIKDGGNNESRENIETKVGDLSNEKIQMMGEPVLMETHSVEKNIETGLNSNDISNSFEIIEKKNSEICGHHDDCVFLSPANADVPKKPSPLKDRCVQLKSGMFAKRKRDFTFLQSNTQQSRRKGISESELSESSLDSAPESSAQSSVPEDGPPSKKQRKKALINRFRRNKLRNQIARTDNNFLFGGDRPTSNLSSSFISQSVQKEKALEILSINGGDVKSEEGQGELKGRLEIEKEEDNQDPEEVDTNVDPKSVNPDALSNCVENETLGDDKSNKDASSDGIKDAKVESTPVEDSLVVYVTDSGNNKLSDNDREECITSKEMKPDKSEALVGKEEDKEVTFNGEEWDSSKSVLSVNENVNEVLRKSDEITSESPKDALGMVVEKQEASIEAPPKSGTKRPSETDKQEGDDSKSEKNEKDSSDSPGEPAAPKKRCSESDLPHASHSTSSSIVVTPSSTNAVPSLSSDIIDDINKVALLEECNDVCTTRNPDGTGAATPTKRSPIVPLEESESKTENGISKDVEERLQDSDGKKKSKKMNGDDDFVELRRSSRVNKGQRKVEMLELEFPSRRRKKKEEMTEEEREKKISEKGKRRTERMMRQMAEEYEELLQAKKDKKKRLRMINDDDEYDEDFIPGVRRNLRSKRRKQNDDEDDDEDDDDDDDSDEDDGDVDKVDDVTLLSRSSTSEEELLESDGSLYEPTGRNAKRVASLNKSNSTRTLFDQKCLMCDKKSEPEFMLLCDKCDDGYHTWCLKPALHIIPDGDWFCPRCEHKILVLKLQEQLYDYDEKAKLNVKLTNRKERLAFVNFSLNNILMEKEDDELADKTRETESNGYSDDEDRFCEDNDDESPNLRNGDEKSKDVGKRKKILSVDRRRVLDDDDDEDEVDASRKNRKKNRLSSSSSSSSTSSGSSSDAMSEEESEKRGSKNRLGRRTCLQSDDEDDRNGKAKSIKKKIIFEDDDDDDEVEGDWLITRRSRRSRKEINYKFEEYENLISGAIEDDVKETYGAGNYGRGKDMANITGAKNNSSNSPVENGKKRRKKKKKFSVLDSDDEGGNDADGDDDSEEFKIEDSVTADEDDEDEAATEIDQSESEAKSAKFRREDSSRKSRRNKKRSRAFDDYVVEEDELMMDAKSLKRPPARRAAVMKGINYNEYSDDDDDDDDDDVDDDESYAKRKKEESKKSPPLLKKDAGKKRARHFEEGDDDYEQDEDDDEEDEDDFLPSYKENYDSDNDLKDFIKSGSSSSSSTCSLSPSRKVTKKTTSTSKKKITKTSSNTKRRKKTVGNASGKGNKKVKNTKKKKRKPWYTSDSEDDDDEEASLTKDSYSDDDFACYAAPLPQKRAGRRALKYKDEELAKEDVPSESIPVSTSSSSISSPAPTQNAVPQQFITGDSQPSSQSQVDRSLQQPISTLHQVSLLSVPKVASPIPQVAIQRLPVSHPLAKPTGITLPHLSQLSAIGRNVGSPTYQISPMVQTISVAQMPRFAVCETQSLDLSCNSSLPSLQAITRRVPSFGPHVIAGGHRSISQDPFSFSAAHHFPGTSTISDPRTIPPLPPLYPIMKGNYLMNAPVAMAMRSGMTSFGGLCNIAPPPPSRVQKLSEEQVMMNPFNEKLSSFSVRNITSVAPRSFKPPYGTGLPEASAGDDFLDQDIDITEFLNPGPNL